MQALGEHGDFARHRTEELGVAELEGPGRRPAAQRFRPAGQAGERPDHAHADDEQGERGEGQHEDEESDAVDLQDVPLGGGQRARVEHDEHHADDPFVPQRGARVDVDRGPGQAREPAPRRPGVERGHHLRIRLGHDRAHLGRRDEKPAQAVEEGHGLRRLAELRQEPLEGGFAAAGEAGLRGVLQRLAEDAGALLEDLEQSPPLLDHLEVGKAPDDDEDGEPDGADEAG